MIQELLPSAAFEVPILRRRPATRRVEQDAFVGAEYVEDVGLRVALGGDAGQVHDQAVGLVLGMPDGSGEVELVGVGVGRSAQQGDGVVDSTQGCSRLPEGSHEVVHGRASLPSPWRAPDLGAATVLVTGRCETGDVSAMLARAGSAALETVAQGMVGRLAS